MRATPHPNTEEILALRGKKSMSLIAAQFGITRNVVAGIFFRSSHPGERLLGTGPRTGVAATEVISKGGAKVGDVRKQTIRKALEEIARICRSETPNRFAREQIGKLADDAIAYANYNKDYEKGRRQKAKSIATSTYSARNYPL